MQKLELVNDFGVLIMAFLTSMQTNRWCFRKAPGSGSRGDSWGWHIPGMARGPQMEDCSPSPVKAVIANSPKNRRGMAAAAGSNAISVWRLSVERIVSGTGLGHVAHWLLNQPHAQNHPCRDGDVMAKRHGR